MASNNPQDYGEVNKHTNSQGERIVIIKAAKPKWEGQLLLGLIDDPPPKGTSALALTLLDEGTKEWLKAQL